MVSTEPKTKEVKIKQKTELKIKKPTKRGAGIKKEEAQLAVALVAVLVLGHHPLVAQVLVAPDLDLAVPAPEAPAPVIHQVQIAVVVGAGDVIVTAKETKPQNGKRGVLPQNQQKFMLVVLQKV